jgi:hypothetical protein
VKTEQSHKLTEFIEYIETYVLDDGITQIVRDIQKRLDELEIAIIKMDSAFRTNPLTGDKTVRAIVQVLLEGRR